MSYQAAVSVNSFGASCHDAPDQVSLTVEQAYAGLQLAVAESLVVREENSKATQRLSASHHARQLASVTDEIPVMRGLSVDNDWSLPVPNVLTSAEVA